MKRTTYGVCLDGRGEWVLTVAHPSPFTRFPKPTVLARYRTRKQAVEAANALAGRGADVLVF